MSDAQALAETQEGHTRVLKDELVEKLKANRTQHAKDYQAAIKGWRKQYAKALLKHADQCRALADKATSEGPLADLRYDYADLPSRPTDHTVEYDRIIARMEMSQDKEQFITHSDFGKFVLDEWRWKEEFSNAVSNYTQS